MIGVDVQREVFQYGEGVKSLHALPTVYSSKYRTQVRPNAFPTFLRIQRYNNKS